MNNKKPKLMNFHLKTVSTHNKKHAIIEIFNISLSQSLDNDLPDHAQLMNESRIFDHAAFTTFNKYYIRDVRKANWSSFKAS